MSVQLATVLANIALAILKFVVGHIAGSRALVADGFNSAGDVLATFGAWLAFRFARRAPDANHPYGHGNAEALAGLLIAGMLLATGGFIAIDGIDAWFQDAARFDDGGAQVPPGRLALLAAAITIVTKAVLWRVATTVGRRNNSPTLLASARDHQADVVIGITAFIAIGLSRLGWTAVDGIVAIGIGVYILVLGIKPLRDNVAILMHEAPDGYSKRVAAIAAASEGVLEVGDIRVQPLGGSYRIDLVLRVDGASTVRDGHAIAHCVEEAVRDQLDHVLEVYVHVEPA